MCQANEQLLGGSKGDLVARCCDGELRGGMPRCPACGVATLHSRAADAAAAAGGAAAGGHDGDARFYCPGYFDSRSRAFVRWCAAAGAA